MIISKNVENSVNKLIELTGNKYLVARSSGNLWNLFEVNNGVVMGAFGNSSYYKYTKKEFVIYMDGLITGINSQLV